MSEPRSALADPSFRLLWLASLAAQAASAIGGVIVPLLALSVLGLTSGTVVVLATAAACTALVTGIPAGTFSEFRRKRPILIGADLGRFALFAILGIFQILGQLDLVHLLVVVCGNAALQILFGSASMAHAKDLIPSRQRADALGKLQSATWLAMILGPVLAGVLVAAVPIGAVIVAIAALQLASALTIARIPRSEGPPPIRARRMSRFLESVAGVRFLATDVLLRRVLLSWVIFAGAVAALTPVTQVFYLRDLAFSATEYGVVMGVPSLAALLGSWVAGRVLGRWGIGRTVMVLSLLRVPVYCVFPLLAPGRAGLVGAVLAFAAVLLLSSIVNTGLSALRLELVPDELMSRTSSAWMMATMLSGPIVIPLAGIVMAAASPRAALWGICALVAASAVVLPMRRLAGWGPVSPQPSSP